MDNRDKITVSKYRRAILSAIGSSVTVSGCITSRNGKSADTSKVVTSDSPSPTISATEDTQTVVSTERNSAPASSTDDPDTPTPTPKLNKTQYSVGLPYQVFGLSANESPLLGGEDADPGVYPVRSKSEWKEIRTAGSQNAAETFEGYNFVSETDFSSETIVIIQRSYLTGVVMQLESVSGVGTSHISMRARRVGKSWVNTTHFRYLFVRLPTDGEKIERITVKIEEFDEMLTLKYDGSGTPTPFK